MKNVLALVLGMVLVGCASAPEKRLTTNDPVLRIVLDPDSLQGDAAQYARATRALVKTKKFLIIDRGAGFFAVKSEEQKEFRTEHDRFAPEEKYSRWGKLYGAGGVVAAHADCYRTQDIFAFLPPRKTCHFFMTLLDSRSGQILVAVDGTNSSSESDTPDWDEVAQALADEFPKRFEELNESESLKAYHKESAIESKKQEEFTTKVVGEIKH